MEPPPSWWVLTYLNHTRSWNELYVCAFTNFPDHLWMAYAYHKPRRQGIWRVVRGKEVFCGYKYIWDTPIIVEQNRPGDTSDHVWLLQRLESDRHIWYYLFAPLGPYGLEIQGPLMHVPPPEIHLWSEKVIVGTQEKGIFYTDTFSGPGGPPPVWQTLNGGLYSLKIWQLARDPLGIQHRQYCLAGEAADRTLYQRIPPSAPGWTRILTAADGEALTSTTTGRLLWVTTNVNHPAYLYVLFRGFTTQHTAWLLRSPDYGATWTAHPIYLGTWFYQAGNLSIGIVQGASPHDPGNVIYATVNHFAGGRSYIYRSFDNGTTWTAGDFTDIMLEPCRCLVDPTDQAIVYMGGFGAGFFPRRLFRSTDHGATWLNISDGEKLGTFIYQFPANLWIDPTNHDFLRVLQDNHVWTSPDSGANWEDWGLTDVNVARHTATWENPNRLYLARHTSGAFPPAGPLNHVIFVSDTHGIYMEGKAGANAWAVDGMGDSIPYNCGGVSLQGMMLFPPY
ncbi:hypothetical protein ES703_47018 [subsurface metagenome]